MNTRAKLMIASWTLACFAPLIAHADINPMLGTNTYAVSSETSGIALNGVGFGFVYDTGRQTQLFGMRNPASFGKLWTTSFHRSMVVSPDKTVALVSRGDGSIDRFTGNGAGVFNGIAVNKNKLTTVSTDYLFYNADTGEYDRFNSTGKLIRITNSNSTYLTFSYLAGNYLSSVTDSNGKTITFAYVNGLISTITNADGRVITAAYDAIKNLTSLTWPDGKSRQFLYENASFPSHMTGEVDESSVQISTWGYDTGGRATSVSHPGGVNSYSVSWTTPPVASQVTETVTAGVIHRTITQTPPTGLVITRADGQVVNVSTTTVNNTTRSAGQTQPAGSGCMASATAATYGANGLLASLDDYSGMRSCFVTDIGRNLRTGTITGLSNSTDCSTLLGIGSTLPLGAKRISTTWHPDVAAKATVISPLMESFTVYNGQPNVLPPGPPLTCTTAPTLPDGKPAILACKEVVKATLDPNGASGVSDDLYFPQVSLLLHADGVDGSTTLGDSSPLTNSTGIAFRNAKVSITKSKFGGSSIYIPGATDYADTFRLTGDYSLPGDFTVEFWVNPAGLSTTASFYPVQIGNSAANFVQFYMNGNGLAAYAKVNGTVVNNAYTGGGLSALTNTWIHVAYVRIGTTLTAYVNGVVAGTSSLSGIIGGTNFVYIGQNGTGLAHYIDDVRITKGLGRYTAAFTPSTLPTAAGTTQATSVVQFTYDSAGRLLTAKDALNATTTYGYYGGTSFTINSTVPYDSNWGSVGLLLHGDGVSGSSSFVDSSSAAKTLTTVGPAANSAVQSKFGGASIAFNGASYLSVSNPAGFNLGNNDFTIEAWVYPTSTFGLYGGSRFATITAQDTSSSRAWWFRLYSDTAGITAIQAAVTADGSTFVASTGSTVGSTAIPLNQWSHIAMTRGGGYLRTFVNGIQANQTPIGTGVLSSASPVTVGGLAWGGSESYFPGFIDDLRITVGAGRYAANFTPPVAAFLNNGLVADPADFGHRVGDLSVITNAAGQATQFTKYDRAGRLLQYVDPKGIVTAMTYTPRGWISTVSVTPPGGTARVTTYTYDFVGQVTGVSNPDGTTIGYTYDAAHRLIGATDAKGNSVNYTLDNMGNRINEQLKDPGGVLQRTMSRSFDALNRVQQLQLQ